MSKGINTLCEIAKKEKKIIIGLMSGTSLDGLDIALCEFSGFGFDTSVRVLNFVTKPFSEDFKARVRAIFSTRSVDLEQVCIMNDHVGRVHANLIREALEEWDVDSTIVDLIASHGQTIYHAPASLHKIEGMPDSTLQIGDGDHIAVGTGIITISDFRQKNIAAGGEGAPLAVYGDQLIFASKDENRVLLNIGGISNFTFLPTDDRKYRSFSTDVGPGNTIMDAYVRNYFPGKSYDEGAEIASSGTINKDLLRELLSDPFFDLPLPKSTGPELFHLEYLDRAIHNTNTVGISKVDIMATLNRFTAEAIAGALKVCTDGLDRTTVYTSGGGMHNPLIIKNLEEILPDIQVKAMDELGIHPDAKEAVLFALLANECLAKDVANTFDDKNVPQVRMGKISLPD